MNIGKRIKSLIVIVYHQIVKVVVVVTVAEVTVLAVHYQQPHVLLAKLGCPKKHIVLSTKEHKDVIHLKIIQMNVAF